MQKINVAKPNNNNTIYFQKMSTETTNSTFVPFNFLLSINTGMVATRTSEMSLTIVTVLGNRSRYDGKFWKKLAP
jgi:hypothetical protein